jgi:hypothetical protein
MFPMIEPEVGIEYMNRPRQIVYPYPDGAGRIEDAIERMHRKLLAEHLGVTDARLSATLDETGSLLRAIDALGGSKRRLIKLEINRKSSADGAELVPERDLLDPEEPIKFDQMMDCFVYKEDEENQTGKRSARLSRRLADDGIIAVAIIRDLPVAPLTIVNMIAGASHIKLKDFLVGTAIGMLPGILGVVVFSDRLLNAVRNPNWFNVSIATGVAVLIGIGSWWINRRLSRKTNT